MAGNAYRGVGLPDCIASGEAAAEAAGIALVADRPARLLATIRSRCRPLVLGMPPREEALAWLTAQGIANASVALALAGGAPLLALELADGAEEPLRKKVIGELVRPGGAHALAFATGFDRPQVERTLFWMQTWVHDLVRVKTAGQARHHVDNAAALVAKARRASLEGLLWRALIVWAIVFLLAAALLSA